jgi:hypothetical protein
MATFKALTRGTQLVLVAGPLLLLSLFFTWQNVEVSYAGAGSANMALDGWDAWGLLLALIVLSVVVLVALRGLSDVELPENVAWAKVCLGLGLAVLAVAVVKNLTDSGSSWASYGFVALAGVVALGTFLDWSAERRGARPTLAPRKRRGLRSAA